MLRNIALTLLTMILSLSVHEYAHAFVATKLGDDLPRRQGRLTLSPLPHIDLMGTIIIPLMGVATGGAAFFGWARPVQTQPTNFRRDIDMRTGMALVAAAGPISNLVLALISVASIALLQRNGGLLSHQDLTPFGALAISMFQLNVGLFVFNFLPFPPLDGSRLLPRSLDSLVEQMSRYSMLFFLAVIMIRPLNELLVATPMRFVSHLLLSLFGLA